MKTTITLSNKLANELNRLKYLYGLKTIEEVITKYIQVEPKDTWDKNSQTVPATDEKQEVANTGSSSTLKPLSKQEDKTSC